MSDNCTVCQDVFDNPKFLHCGHTFCCKCIDAMIGLSKGPNTIKCPLCRQVTKCQGRGTEELMCNYFVTDKIHAARISTCKECRNISEIKACERCQECLCEDCLFIHMKTKCGKEGQERGIACLDTNREEEEYSDELNMGLEERLMSEVIQTKYLFELDRRIVVPNDYNEGMLNINLSLIACFNENEIMIAPNGDSVVLIYNDKGEEILRDFLGIRVIGISSGIEGFPLLIRGNFFEVYRYSYGCLEPMFSTPSISPRALSSFNNGRIVVVGVKLIHTSQGSHETDDATFRIYEYTGSIVEDISPLNGENVLGYPTSVCVNLANNDFFVGDKKKRQVVRFREDGSCVSSYKRAELPDAYLGIPVPTGLINRSAMFPLSLAYSQVNDLLFASYLTAVDNGIYVLSPSLDLLGLFTSTDDHGIPAGLSCDSRGRLYVGDGRDGIIRVFKLSIYLNRV